MKRIAVAVVAAVTMSACGSSLEPEVDRLAGSWDWVEATGGFAGETRTPESTGDTQSLDFDANGTVRRFTNGESDAFTTWELVEVESGLVLRYGEPMFGFEEQSVTFEGNDTLILADPCCDGFTYTWERQ